MHDLYNLRDVLVKELEDFGRRGELSKPSLDAVNKIAHAAKNVCKVIDYCKQDDYTVEADESVSKLKEELRKMIETL